MSSFPKLHPTQTPAPVWMTLAFTVACVPGGAAPSSGSSSTQAGTTGQAATGATLSTSESQDAVTGGTIASGSTGELPTGRGDETNADETSTGKDGGSSGARDLVFIELTDDAQLIVDANPEGTGFAFRAGVHTGVSVLPKDEMSFIADPAGGAVILDGENSVGRAFRSDNVVHGVSISGLEITRYVPGSFSGVVDAGSQEWADPEPWNPATEWTLSDLHVHHNGGHPESSAVHVGSGTQIHGGSLHHNAGQGIGGHGHTIEIDGVEIAYNSSAVTDSLYWHSGGIKLVVVHGASIRDCEVHHNVGPGIWFDVNGDDNLIENNHIHDNGLSGIMYEISRRGTIRGNVLSGNGFAEGRGWLWPAAILVSSAYECDVVDNVLTDNVDGMVVVDQRTLRTNGDDIHGPDASPAFGRLYDDNGVLVDAWYSADCTFTDNSLQYTGQTGASASGAESFASDVYDTTVFSGNEYGDGVRWVWGEGDQYASPLSFDEWTAAGNDG